MSARGATQRLRSAAGIGRRILAWEDARFDRRLGIATAGVLEPVELTVPDGDPTVGFTYVATPVRVARWCFRAVPGRPQDFTLIDMGSGKGRVLALAAEHGYRSVIGVEFASELHEIACANAAAAGRRGLEFEPVLSDAGTFVFPETPLVVHFNNPFGEQVMSRVIANLRHSYETMPRPIVLLYQEQRIEEERHRTRNLSLVEETGIFATRMLVPERPLDRRLLRDVAVRYFESQEAVALTDRRRTSGDVRPDHPATASTPRDRG